MTSLTLPQLSLSMEEAKVLRWLVDDGAEVAAGEPVVEVETDKATMEVEAPEAGVLRVLVQAGTVVPVDGVLAEIAGNGAAEVEPAAGPETAESGSAREQVPAMERGAGEQVSARGAVASPAARRVAAQGGIDLASVAGSGPGGRIVVRDLDDLVGKAPAPAAAGTDLVAADTLRRAVVASVSASWREIPHIHIGGELAADGLLAAHRRAAPGPVKVTVTDLLLKALAAALADVPELNGVLASDGSVRRSSTADVSLAVATAGGVVAPVLRDVGARTAEEVARERARLVDAARAGALEKRDLGGGTCTLSNLGSYPVDFFAPIVSGPQIAMVATGRIAEKPVAESGWIAVRPRIWVNVAIDHRAADGEAGARLLAALERHLNPTSGGLA